MPRPLKNALKPIEPNAELIGDRLQRLRKKRGLTQAELAEQIGITREAVSAYEAGRVRLVDEIVIRCAIILHVSTDELLGVSMTNSDDSPSLRIMRRVKKIERLPPAKQKAVLQTLDLALQNVDQNLEG
jgi:transcriptional regulator with XRE-family HTH domain